MKLKFKTGLFSLGAIASITSPLAFAISCSPLLGKIGKYDSKNDGVVTIQTTWSAGGTAIQALEDAVKKYNSEESGTPGFMHVKVEHVEGGYGTIPSQLIIKIQSKDTKTLPNLYIDYPSAVGQIAPYDMVYDATSITLQRSLFEKDFVESNDRISGVKNGGIFSVPLSKSTEAMVYDKPLLKHLITEVSKEYPLAVSSTNNTIINDILTTNISSSDLAEIKKQWGTIKKSQSVLPDVINDDIFNDYTSLRNFIIEIQPLFTNPGGGNLLGIDSPSNYLYLISSLMSKNKDEDFLMNKNKDTGFVDFNFIKDGSTQKSTFTKSYTEYLYKPISKGAMWVGGGGAYGSTRLSKHQMAISIGSSAGLSHSVDRGAQFLNNKEVGFASPPNHLYSTTNMPKDGYNWDKLTSSISQGPSFNTVWINKAENTATKKFLDWFYTKDKGNANGVVNEFSKKSQYIVPTNGAFDSNSTISKLVSNQKYEDMSPELWGLKMSLETIKGQLANDKQNVVNNVNSKMFEPPIDDSTGIIRKILDSKIKASANSFNSGGSPYSSDRIWRNIHKQSIIDNIITGSLNQTKYNYPNQMNRNFSNIDWSSYQYVDAIIDSWTDGDTPNVTVSKVHANSPTSPVNQLKTGDKLAIRISGIDTPEAHVKLGEIKRSVNIDGVKTATSLDDKMVADLIDSYRNKGKPLAVFAKGHYNELHYKEELDGIDPKYLNPKNSADKTALANALNKKYGYTTTSPFSFDKFNLYGKYTDWKSIYIDIQTPDLNDRSKGYDPILKDTKFNHGSSTYDLRSVRFPDGTKLITDLATTEGYWGLKAGEFGRDQMPKGTKVRIATDGNKSYNRIVGSIFYGQYLENNWSVEIIKKGLTMPFISDPASATDPSNILWENGQAIADAFNYSIKKQNGLFKYSSGSLDLHLKWILTIHGVTKYTNLLHKSDESTIYDYMMYRNPDKEKTGAN